MKLNYSLEVAGLNVSHPAGVRGLKPRGRLGS